MRFEKWLGTVSLWMQDGIEPACLVPLLDIRDRSGAYVGNFGKIGAVEVIEKRQNVELLEHLGWTIPKSFFICNPMVFFRDNHLEHG